MRNILVAWQIIEMLATSWYLFFYEGINNPKVLIYMDKITNGDTLATQIPLSLVCISVCSYILAYIEPGQLTHWPRKCGIMLHKY